MLVVSQLCFGEVEAAPAVSCYAFIGLGPPRRKPNTLQFIPPRRESCVEDYRPLVAGDRGILIGPVNFLLRDGNNRCATQFG
jgi:hypothetical protein